MKPQKHRQDDDFKIPDELLSLKEHTPFIADESYFERNEDLWLTEAKIKSIASPENIPFSIESKYFETSLPRLLQRTQPQIRSIYIFKLREWSYAAAAILAILLTVYPFFKSADVKHQPTQQTVSDEELITYLHENISALEEEYISGQIDYTYNTNQINIEALLEEHPELLYSISTDDIQSL